MDLFLLLKAFLVGGIICAIGQVLIDYTKLTPARILVSYVVLGVILGGIGLYQPLIDFAGAGATIPLTGFGATLAKGVREAVSSDGLFGAFTGGLTASAGGITVAIIAALLAGLLCKSSEKAKEKILSECFALRQDFLLIIKRCLLAGKKFSGHQENTVEVLNDARTSAAGSAIKYH